MSSHKKNPPVVSKSLQQEMDSEKTNAEADVKPFSIRQYALAWRHRSIFHSWPFPEKYLHMCLSRGIRDVLPPLFASQTCEEDESSLKGCCSKNLINYHGNNNNNDDDDREDAVVDDEFCKTHSNIKKNNEYGTSFHDDDDDEEGNKCIVPVNNNVAEEVEEDEVLNIQPISSSIVHVHKTSPSPTMALFSNKGVKDKRRRRRGRCKKRSMADILADARYCTVEEIYSMNKFYYAAAIEGSHQQQIMGPYSENDEGKNGSEDDYEEHHHEVCNSNNDLNGKGTLLLKFKLNAYDVNRNSVT